MVPSAAIGRASARRGSPSVSLKARGHTVSFVDAFEVQLPLLDRMYKDTRRARRRRCSRGWPRLYRAADAFVIVTGEYNHSMPPALSNLLNHFLEEYYFRPSAIVSYSGGQFGGVRAAVHLQAIALRARHAEHLEHVPGAESVRRRSTRHGNELTPGAGRRFERFAAELEWYAEAMKRQREEKGVPR